MNESRGNLWSLPADLRVVTTNGFVKRNGQAVMGRGCAEELAAACPHVPAKLGALLSTYGNRPFRIAAVNGAHVATLPVKHHWRQKADIDLIVASIHYLKAMVIKFEYQNILIPRPGCGNGKLSWSQVRPRIEPLLDDRFTVVTF